MHFTTRCLTFLVLGPLLGLACLTGCSVTDAPRRVVRGPLPTRHQHPVGLTLLQFLPRRAVTQAQGSTDLRVSSAYSSIYEIGDDMLPGEELRFDGEIWRTAFGLRYGVVDGVDVEVAVPIVYTTSGFLDHIVDQFHEFLSLPDAGRSTAPSDQWRTFAEIDGERAWEMEEDRLGLGDIPVVATLQLLDEDDDGFSLAGRAGIELPTGSESAGFGNGAIDAGGGVIAERSLSRWTFTGGADYVFTQTPSSFDRAGAELLDVFDVQGGVECRLNNTTSLLLGLVYTSPMTRDFESEEFDSPILDLGVGAAWTLGERSRLSFSFHEDLISKAGPDFAFYLAWTLSL